MTPYKCTNIACSFRVTNNTLLPEENPKSKVKLCPDCNSKLTKNVSEDIARKKLYGYLNKDKSIVDFLVLVIIDEFDNKSLEVEIPLLDLRFTCIDHIDALKKTRDAISVYLKQEYNASYSNDHQFMTVAYWDERNPVERNKQVWWTSQLRE